MMSNNSINKWTWHSLLSNLDEYISVFIFTYDLIKLRLASTNDGYPSLPLYALPVKDRVGAAEYLVGKVIPMYKRTLNMYSG